MKGILTLFFLGILGAMLGVTIWASLDRSVLDAGKEIWADPWGRATLFDAYFGFLVVYVWIFYRESSVLARGIWFVLLMTLGNIAIAVYFLLALRSLPPGASWTALFQPAGKGGLQGR